MYKKDGSLRICIGFGKLNLHVVKDIFATTRIKDPFIYLQDQTLFTTLDLKAGYWQVELNKDDTVQVCNFGFYECSRMHFGLCNAPATFHCLIKRAMGNLNQGVSYFLG